MSIRKNNLNTELPIVEKKNQNSKRKIYKICSMVLVTTDCKFYVSPSLCSYPGELGLVTHHALLLLNAGTTGVAAFRETICSSNLDAAHSSPKLFGLLGVMTYWIM